MNYGLLFGQDTKPLTARDENECVWEWVNAGMCCKALRVVSTLEELFINEVYLPFTIVFAPPVHKEA